MVETLFVLGLVSLLVALGLATAFASLEGIFVVGLAAIALGLCVGMPAGAYYHMRLYQYVARRGRVSRDFWFHPTRYHGLLEPAEWRCVAPWFFVGGAGFGLIVLGCLAVLVAVWKA